MNASTRSYGTDAQKEKFVGRKRASASVAFGCCIFNKGMGVLADIMNALDIAPSKHVIKRVLSKMHKESMLPSVQL